MVDVENLVRLIFSSRAGPRFHDVAEHAFDDLDVGFSHWFQENIAPQVDEFESKRRKTLVVLQFRMHVAITVVAAAIFVGGILISMVERPLVGLFGLVLFSKLIVAWAYNPVIEYESEIKWKIFPLLFQYFGPDFTYQEEGELSAEKMCNSGIIPDFRDEDREDYVRGTRHGIRLELTETKLTKERYIGKLRQTVTVFRGMLLLLTVNKPFAGQTVLKQDQGGVLNFFSKPAGSAYETVKLEDPEFERIFEVYSTDQVEARYLLTPSFMERLIELKTLFRGSAIQGSFFQNKLLLTFSSDFDRFEAGSVFVPVTFIDEARTVVREMTEIFRIIDTLKLTDRTGL